MSPINSEAEAVEPDFLKELVEDQEFEDMFSRHLVLAGLLDPDQVFPMDIPPLPRKYADEETPKARKARSGEERGHRSRHPRPAAGRD